MRVEYSVGRCFFLIGIAINREPAAFALQTPRGSPPATMPQLDRAGWVHFGQATAGMQTRPAFIPTPVSRRVSFLEVGDPPRHWELEW